MSSRDAILATVKSNQPAPRDLPPLPGESGYTGSAEALTSDASATGAPDLTPAFISTLESIGGSAFIVSGFDRIATILHEQYRDARRIISGCPQLQSFAAAATGDPHTTGDPHAIGDPHTADHPHATGDPHTLEDVDLAILPVHFGVAENGACWITESQMIERALPFITQHLALVLHRQDIVADMHQAYDRIAALDAANPYHFATFIAGPSKTADIEQSLVLGAHGPRSLTVFLLDEHLSDAGFY